MKPVLLALMAVLCFALGNVLLEQELRRFHALTLMSVYVWAIWLAAILTRHVLGIHDPFPDSARVWAVIALLALTLFAGEALYAAAYTSTTERDALYTVTAIFALMPAAASLLRLFWVREWPNVYQLGAFTLAIGVVVLAAKGSGR
jgi:drug/metabolite transporter (DMT)-like permease